MSTSSLVPESEGLDGHRAWASFRAYGLARLTIDTYARLRYADGFSHSRALAYQLVLTLIPGVIIAVALGTVISSETLIAAISDAIESFAPGSASELFQAAAAQGSEAGGQAIAGGGVAFAIAGVTTFSQIQRAANRIYGIEADRPTIPRYILAIELALSAGGLLLVFFAVIGIGSATPFVDDGNWRTLWLIARWPLGILLIGSSYALIFKIAPDRRQPAFSWLALGAGIATIGTLGVSLAFRSFLGSTGSFGQTYGIFAGLIGLVLWAYATAIAMFAGLAVAAQLEANHAGISEPRSAEKVVAGRAQTRGAAHEAIPNRDLAVTS